MNTGGSRSAVMCLSAAFVAWGGALSAAVLPSLNLSGNLGYNFRQYYAQAGSQNQNSQVLGSLAARGYLWQPWFATADGGGSLSMSSSSSALTSRDVQLVSGHLNLNVFPKSRFPFRLAWAGSDNVNDWMNEDKPYLIDFGDQYHSRFLGVRQKYIGRGGNHLDAWFNQRTRGSQNDGDVVDEALGFNWRYRLPGQNFYMTSMYQEKLQSLSQNQAENITVSVNHNFVPDTTFYLNTLIDYRHANNHSDASYGSIRASSLSRATQWSSHFFWRPDHKPYTLTGAVRMQSRILDYEFNDEGRFADNNSFNASISSSYAVTSRLRLLMGVNGGMLSTDTTELFSNSLSAGGTLTASYRGDQILFKGFTYSWYSNAGWGNTVLARYDDVTTSDRFSASVGHSALRAWKTGNRSVLRFSMTQVGQPFVGTGDKDSYLGLNHSASLGWRESGKRRSLHGQLSVVDNRQLGMDTDMQLLNAQISLQSQLSRLSSGSAHLTVQGSRRSIEGQDGRGVVTSSTGRLAYRHQRLFGIYRLKFNSKLDLGSSLSETAFDRWQLDWESRAGYKIGLLNAGMTYRLSTNDMGGVQHLGFVQINRSF